MSLSRATWLRPAALLLILPLLGASKCRRNAKDEDATVDTDDRTGGAQDIALSISVVSVEPSSIPANQSATINVLGAGFQAGAKVFVGGTQAERATVVGSTRIEARLPALASGTYDVEVENPNGEASVLRAALMVGTGSASSSCTSLTVYFDLDSNTLRGDAVSLLTSQIDCITGANGSVLIEGHCDERGTTDYNLALGQRRAEAVVRWLTARGVPAGRVRAISYGEERPAEVGSGDAAWAKNRRAEIRLER